MFALPVITAEGLRLSVAPMMERKEISLNSII
jgi:hypothetical protein